MIQSKDIVRAWGRILLGHKPALSIEITKECPLRCPGCYAFDPAHLGDGRELRQLSDLRGEALIAGVLRLVDRLRPLHLSLVGGDPLVRYRELERLVPALLERGIFVQIVTSAFRPLPAAWAGQRCLELVVSVDGLAPEHDQRRAPATYERIQRHIRGHQVTVHCTITAGMLDRPGYLGDFLAHWSANPDAKRVWFSLFTPQRGAELPETPTAAQRAAVVGELERLRLRWPKLDMRPGAIAALRPPPLRLASASSRRSRRRFPRTCKRGSRHASSAAIRIAPAAAA